MMRTVEETVAEALRVVALRARLTEDDVPAHVLLDQVAQILAPAVERNVFGEKPTAAVVFDMSSPTFCAWCGHVEHANVCGGTRDERCTCDHPPIDHEIVALLDRVADLLEASIPVASDGYADLGEAVAAVRGVGRAQRLPVRPRDVAGAQCPECGRAQTCTVSCRTAVRNDWPRATT
jgi:hypothetical protein